MRLTLILSVIFLSWNRSLIAQNIVNDPSFEMFFGSSPWRGILSTDRTQEGLTQEGHAYPTDGIMCMGLRFDSPIEPNWQESIYQSVTTEMQAGVTYKVSMTYRLAERCANATDDLGIGFLYNTEVMDVTQEMLANWVPQVRNPEGNVLSNNDEARTLSGYYTANGTESVVAVGCFKSGATLSMFPVTAVYDPIPDVYYYIDEVSVHPCPSFDEVELPDFLVFCDDSAALSLHIPGTANATYLWSTGETDSIINVPREEGFVSVEVTKNGCVVRDSTQIHVFSGKTELGDDQLLCSSANYPVELKVEMQQFEHITWDNLTHQSTRSVTTSGTYFYELTSGVCEVSDTITFSTVENDVLLYPNPVKTTFSYNTDEDVIVLGIVNEKGQYLFKGTESLSNLDALILSLPPAIYMIDAEINGCRVLNKFEKIKMTD